MEKAVIDLQKNKNLDFLMTKFIWKKKLIKHYLLKDRWFKTHKLEKNINLIFSARLEILSNLPKKLLGPKMLNYV